MGHAVNKIMKDITNRSLNSIHDMFLTLTCSRYQVSRGRRVHYVPGWDCHGLPIEMKAVRGGDKKQLGAEKIRDIASR